MDSPLGDLSDKAFEQLEDVKNTAIREARSLPKTIKQQVFESPRRNPLPDEKGSPGQKDVDPVSGKPVPSRKVVNQIAQATAEVAKARIKKLREELDKQKLKTSEKKKVVLSPLESAKKAGIGPEIPETETGPERDKKDKAVETTLKGSKSTGEYKGIVGG